MKRRARTPHARGFTLVELMVTVALFSLLAMFAYPSYTSFIRSSQVRGAAESVIGGLQLARAESIRRNTPVQFRLTNTLKGEAMAGGTDWQVLAAVPDSSPLEFSQPVQTRQEDSLQSAARAGVSNSVGADAAAAGAGMPAALTFTGLGRLSTDSTARQIDFTGAEGARRLTILLAPGGDIRLCDPALSLASNPQGCF